MQKVFFILGELSDDDVDWMIQTGRWDEVPAKTILIQEGKPIDALYIILDGTLAVFVSALNNQEIARLCSGEVVGEMSFIDYRPPSATVVAVQDSLVLSIPRLELLTKLQYDIGFASRFFRALAVLLSIRMRGLVSQLGYGNVQSEDIQLDQLNSNILDNISLAKTRFDWMLRRLKNN